MNTVQMQGVSDLLKNDYADNAAEGNQLLANKILV